MIAPPGSPNTSRTPSATSASQIMRAPFNRITTLLQPQPAGAGPERIEKTLATTGTRVARGTTPLDAPAARTNKKALSPSGRELSRGTTPLERAGSAHPLAAG